MRRDNGKRQLRQHDADRAREHGKNPVLYKIRDCKRKHDNPNAIRHGMVGQVGHRAVQEGKPQEHPLHGGHGQTETEVQRKCHCTGYNQRCGQQADHSSPPQDTAKNPTDPDSDTDPQKHRENFRHCPRPHEIGIRSDHVGFTHRVPSLVMV